MALSAIMRGTRSQTAAIAAITASGIGAIIRHARLCRSSAFMTASYDGAASLVASTGRACSAVGCKARGEYSFTSAQSHQGITFLAALESCSVQAERTKDLPSHRSEA